MNATNREIITASELIEKIKSGEPIKNVIIEGDVEYKRSDEVYRIDSKIEVNDCIFKGRVTISLTFGDEVDFSGSIFCREVSFYKSHFEGPVYFSKRHADGFKFAEFKNVVGFREANFRYVDLERVRFENDVDFQEARFFGIVDISRAFFGGVVKFDTVHLDIMQFNPRCKIRLNDALFRRLRVHWNHIEEYIEGANPSDYSALIKNYTELGWFEDADACYLAYKDLFWESDCLKLLTRYLGMKRIIKNFMVKDLRITLKVDNKHMEAMKKRVNKCERILLKFFSFFLFGHFLSLYLYGHGIRLRWPIFSGLTIIVISACIYYHGGQVHSLYPDGLKLSSKIFISTTQVGNLTGFCESWSIVERFVGAILLITSLVVLARKTLR